MISRFNLMSYYKSTTIEQARKSLEADTKIEQDRKSGIITISVISSDAQFACKLADGYVAELNRVLTDSSTSAARRERKFLEGRLQDVKRDLDESSKQLSQFSTKTLAIDIPSQARSTVEASLRLQAAIGESQSQLAALRETYSEDNYRVKAIEARTADLQRQLAELGGVSESPDSHQQKPGSPLLNARSLPSLGLAYSDLERKMRVDEALWESLTKQYEMARVQEAKEIPTVHVLDPATVPSRKAGPRRSIIVYVGTFLAFIISLIVIFGPYLWESMSEDSALKRLIAGLSGRAQKSSQ